MFGFGSSLVGFEESKKIAGELFDLTIKSLPTLKDRSMVNTDDFKEQASIAVFAAVDHVSTMLSNAMNSMDEDDREHFLDSTIMIIKRMAEERFEIGNQEDE